MVERVRKQPDQRPPPSLPWGLPNRANLICLQISPGLRSWGPVGTTPAAPGQLALQAPGCHNLSTTATRRPLSAVQVDFGKLAMRIAAQAAGKPRSRVVATCFSVNRRLGCPLECPPREFREIEHHPSGSCSEEMCRLRKATVGRFHRRPDVESRTAGRGSWQAGPASSQLLNARLAEPASSKRIAHDCQLGALPSSICRPPFAASVSFL